MNQSKDITPRIGIRILTTSIGIINGARGVANGATIQVEPARTSKKPKNK